MPEMPVKAHGMRIEPPPSVPTASWPRPAATCADAPPLEPPGVRSRCHGLRVMPVSALSVTPFQPNSGVQVLPRSTAPDLAQARGRRCVVVPRSGRIDRLRAAQRRPILREHEVLDRRGNAVHGAGRRALHPARLGRARGGERAVGVDEAVGVQLRIERVDAREHRARHLDGRECLRAVACDQLGRRREAQLDAHRVFRIPPRANRAARRRRTRSRRRPSARSARSRSPCSPPAARPGDGRAARAPRALPSETRAPR